jgi:RNA polymerase sigma factor (sigma-70 family)
VLRCRRGDSQAFRELVEIFERRLLYYLRRLSNDEQEAWDILQQVWIKVIRNIRSIQDPRKFKSWLYTVAHRTAADRFHVLAKEQARREEFDPDEIADENSDWEHLENAGLVHYGLGKLPIDQREILTFFFLEEFSIAEIAEILKLPDGTVKSRLHRARNALLSVLTREGGYQ